MTYICRRCRTEIPELNCRLTTCHFCHTYYCGKKCRQLDAAKHQAKCVGAQASMFTKQILRTIVNSNNCPLIQRLCKIAFDGFCVQGRGALLIDLKGLDNLEKVKSVKHLIDQRMVYCPRSRLPDKAVKTKKATCNYDPNESIILAITLQVPLTRMAMTAKEAGRAYREKSQFIESFSIMVNVESPKYRQWWILKSAAVADTQRRKKNTDGGDEAMILTGIQNKRQSETTATEIGDRSDTTSVLMNANPYASCNFHTTDSNSSMATTIVGISDMVPPLEIQQAVSVEVLSQNVEKCRVPVACAIIQEDHVVTQSAPDLMRSYEVREVEKRPSLRLEDLPTIVLGKDKYEPPKPVELVVRQVESRDVTPRQLSSRQEISDKVHALPPPRPDSRLSIISTDALLLKAEQEIVNTNNGKFFSDVSSEISLQSNDSTSAGSTVTLVEDSPRNQSKSTLHQSALSLPSSKTTPRPTNVPAIFTPRNPYQDESLVSESSFSTATESVATEDFRTVPEFRVTSAQMNPKQNGVRPFSLGGEIVAESERGVSRATMSSRNSGNESVCTTELANLPIVEHLPPKAPASHNRVVYKLSPRSSPKTPRREIPPRPENKMIDGRPSDAAKLVPISANVLDETSLRYRHESQMSRVQLEIGDPVEKRSRQMAFAKILGNLRQRGVCLRSGYPNIYQKLCVFVEDGAPFAPIVIYPTDKRTGKPFMCLLMPGGNSASPTSNNRPESSLSSIMQDLETSEADDDKSYDL